MLAYMDDEISHIITYKYLIGSATVPGEPGRATGAASRDQLSSLSTSLLSIVGRVRIRSCRKANFNVRQMQRRSLLLAISFISEMESKIEMAAWKLPKPSAVKYMRPKSYNNIQSPNIHRLLR
ncbi:basic helix-loop-helix DNA-binding family protein [Striga asiatica]|uniref:Basic helix-loop-helix DNA-binding family protein n=1 Tax=Striga asiatica TaxID=4170 RepID=A0A5A7PBH7_STRAF|nr:basic helix-loop-helix DNA-binding family protein [Striga asiatica]